MTLKPNCFVWNARGLNARARRNVVREFLVQHQATLVCLQETKLAAVPAPRAVEILGPLFDYDFVPAVGVAGGILFAWRRDSWDVEAVIKGRFFISAKVKMVGARDSWWITVVYGPQQNEVKVEFLGELLSFRAGNAGPWLLCGDFNLIFEAADKNNGRLDRRNMRRFRAFIDSAHLQDIALIGRRYTWSNGQDAPTLERLDRALATVEWFILFPYHCLKQLSSDCSDHWPLLLMLDTSPGAKWQFRFESFWTKLPGFQEVVALAWSRTPSDADPFRVIDFKLRNVTRALQSWSATKIGSVRLQLALAREIVLGLDEAEESRTLEARELELRRSLKLRTLGLASMARRIARQRSRLTFLAEGDVNTRFFHLQACHRRRKNRITSLNVHGTDITSERLMAQAVYDHFSSTLGSNFERSRRINLAAIGLPSVQLGALEELFTEEEVRAVVMGLPSEKALGPDGFTGLFYKKAWEVIKADVMTAFYAFWSQDARSLHHLNDAFMVLLQKKQHPTQIGDYRPISLIHSFSKLLTKCLANRLATVLDDLIRQNQSAFIKGRCIHDNFRVVRLSCKALHKRKIPSLLLKIDIAKAFDSVCWSFLLEALQHFGFRRRWRNWISVILSTASTKVLLNGVPGRRICHARGLWQGDPLSPMLFVLIMEVVNHTIKWLDSEGMLTQLGHVGSVQRVSLYTDGVMLFLAPFEQDLLVIRSTLHVLGCASGLFANLDKSVATPLHCNDDDIDRVQHILSCRIEAFPSCYLRRAH